MEDRYAPPIVHAINNIAAETLDNFSNDSVPLFAKRGFVKQVRETIRLRLKHCGYRTIKSVMHRYSSPDSTLFVIDVGETKVFYKMSVRGLPEALFTQTLATLLPDLVLVPFGVDINDNSFFTKSFGDKISDHTRKFDDEQSWKHIIQPAVNTIADFHKMASKHVEQLKQLGMEDTSPQRMRIELPQFISELQDRGVLNNEQAQIMRGKLSSIGSQLGVLADGKIPLTVCHGDLHCGNLTWPLTKNGVPLLFDWCESSISHPFLDFISPGLATDSCVEAYAEKWLTDDSSDKVIEMLGMAAALHPVWDTFRRVKTVRKRGHQLGAKQELDVCRDAMTYCLRYFLKR